MEYKVEIKETLSRVVTVKAKSEQEAINKVKGEYASECHILDSGDYSETNFDIVE